MSLRFSLLSCRPPGTTKAHCYHRHAPRPPISKTQAARHSAFPQKFQYAHAQSADWPCLVPDAPCIVLQLNHNGWDCFRRNHAAGDFGSPMGCSFQIETRNFGFCSPNFLGMFLSFCFGYLDLHSKRKLEMKNYDFFW